MQFRRSVTHVAGHFRYLCPRLHTPRFSSRASNEFVVMRWLPFAIGATASLSLMSCEGPTYPRLALPFTPPLKYAVLWRTVEACSGLRGEFRAVRWYRTVGSTSSGGRGHVAGSWWPDGNRIYLNEAYLDYEEVIRHEMLHALDRGEGHAPVFLGSCGGLVTCQGDCVIEAGGLPPCPTSSSAEVLPSELAVAMEVVGPLPGEEGWMAVIISASNPRPDAIWVDLSGSPGSQFECTINQHPCGRSYSYGDARAAFGAGETRREVEFPAFGGDC